MEGKWKYIRDNQQYSINIWILNSLSPSNPKMLYGCVVPIEGQVPLKSWSRYKVDSQKKEDLTIEKLSCFITGEDTKKFINMLEKSRTFKEISINLCLQNPQKYFDHLLLLADDYRYRPPVFLETREATMYYKDGVRPISTLAVNPCICESLTNVNKFKLLETGDETSGKELLTFICSVLTRELPLEIPGPDSQRLGNFEIFNFAYESSMDVAPLKSSIIKDNEDGLVRFKAVEINLKRNRFKGKIYLRCRTRNGNVIIGDQLRLIENGDISQNIIFSILENCSEIEVSVWDAEDAIEQPITLLYEDRIPLMRTMDLSLELVDIKGKLKTNWTNKISNKSGNNSINNEFRRGSRTYFKAGDFENDLWVPASREMMDFVNMIFPEKSNSAFFEKGWQDENRFVKWLQEVVGKHKIHEVILVDPYFDAEAVSKFLGLAINDDLTYKVITDIGLEESKRNEITEACVKIKAILPRSVNIYGLTRAKKGNKQIFHDRFIILCGKTQNPIVYMLSNSISGVAKKFPSVIIPVPDDLGIELVEYYLQLIGNKGKYDVPQINMTALWPIEIPNSDKKEGDNQKEEKKLFPGFQHLKSILFDNNDIPEKQLGSENKLLFAEDFSEKIKQFEKLGEGVNRLLKENPAKAIELWCGIANWSVRMMDESRNEMFDWFSQSKYRDDFIFVTTLCIREGVELDYPLGVKNMECSAECIGIGKQSILPFEKMRDISSSLLNYQYGNDYPVNYSLKMAFHYLMRFAPETAYEVLGSTIDFVSKMDHKKPTTDMMPYYKMIAILVNVIAFNYNRDNLSQLDIGLKSDIAIVRAMHSIIISQYLNSRDNLDNDIDIFEVVDRIKFLESPIEKIFVYSWIAYDCQVLRNRVRDNEIQSNLIDYLKMKVSDEWFLNSEHEKFLRLILKNFSGPIEGDHSNDIFEIIELLVKQSKISQQNATDYIRQVLLEKMDNHMKGIKRIYTKVDIPFTYNSIKYFVSISSEKTEDLANCITKIAKSAKRKLMKPFAKSKSYSEWNRSIEVFCWCGIAITQINIHLKSENGFLVGELKEIYQMLLLEAEDFNDDLMLLKNFYQDYDKVKYY